MEGTTKHIALLGAHDHKFVDKLQEAGYQIAHQASYSDFKSSSTRHHAIAVGNDYHGLLEVSELSRLLDADHVLVAFAPSPEFLHSLHNATQTPINISTLKLEERESLLIFKIGGVVHITVQSTPPHSETRRLVVSSLETRKDPTVIPRSIEPFDFQDTVNLLTEAVNKISLGSVVRPDDSAINDLTPPSGTSYFKTAQYTYSWPVSVNLLAWTSDGSTEVNTSDPTQIQKFILNRTISFYVYATGVDPSGASAADYKGTIYTFAVQDGQFQRAPGPARWFGPNSSVEGESECAFYFMDSAEYSIDGSALMTKVQHQPDTDQYTIINSNEYRYDIDYSQSLAMFKDNGTQTNFTAHYKQPVIQNRFMMHSVELDKSDLGFSIDYKEYYDKWNDPQYQTDVWWDPGVFDPSKNPVVVKTLPHDTIPFRGLSVFKSSVGIVTLTLPCTVNVIAFKSRSWRTASDDDVGHYEGLAISSPGAHSLGLDLTWPARE